MQRKISITMCNFTLLGGWGGSKLKVFFFYFDGFPKYYHNLSESPKLPIYPGRKFSSIDYLDIGDH